jgi:uncharacterized protein
VGREPAALSPTVRTTLGRHRDRARTDRAELIAILEKALICHLGVVVDGHPLVIPTTFGVDPDGPDEAGTLYLHGSVAAQSLQNSVGAQLCVTVTLLEGLVLARSGFNHSMNYRSAVVMGTGRQVVDPVEKRHALDLIVDHAVPGRAVTLRDHTRKELAATSVVALALFEASVKQRSGGPSDDPADIDPGIWAGVIPLALAALPTITADDAAQASPPAHVTRRVAAFS